MAILDNILNYWKLDESSGNATDTVGSATLTNTNITYSTGKISNGAYNAGTNGYKLQGTIADPDSYSSGYSWACWAYVDDNTPTTRQAFMASDESASWGVCSIFALETTGNLCFKFGNGESLYYYTDTGTQVPQATWFHVVTTVNGTNQKCYLNGTLVSNVTKASSLANNGTTFVILNQKDGLTPTTGRVDEAGIWGRELSQTDVNYLYNGGLGRTYPFLNNNFFQFM